MRMKFRCKNCGNVIFLHDELTQKVVDYMIKRQEMWKALWNKDFESTTCVSEQSIVKIIESNTKCCLAPSLEMVSFHGFE